MRFSTCSIYLITILHYLASKCESTGISDTGRDSILTDKPISSPKDYDTRYYFATQIKKFDPTTYQMLYPSWKYEHPIGSLVDHYLFSINKSDPDAYKYAPHTAEHPDSIYKRSEDDWNPDLQILQPVTAKKLYKRLPVANPANLDSAFAPILKAGDELNIHDPGFVKQWHLMNPLQPGNDLNVTDIWRQGITGKSVAVAVVDDGIDMDHEDLAPNYFAEGSWDFNDHNSRPSPKLSDDRHGTRCCGEIAAARNDMCGVGVAYDSKIAGIRILSDILSESDEAAALNYAMDKNCIYSCSWGPQDNGQTMEAPGMLVKKAFLNGVQNGRDKKGSLFVFASGNGASYEDNCNFDGYTNSIYSITIAAIDRNDQHPYYSEPCSANMAVTYSSGREDHIYTTDVDHSCTDRHGGTSAAAPIAAGIFALVLDARPELTWRDLQYLAWDTAVPINVNDGSWQKTQAGKMFHHEFGYGKLDAYAIVERAKTWNLRKPQAWYFSPTVNVTEEVKFDSDAEKGGVFSKITITKDDLKKANFENLEHINVQINLDYSARGVLSVFLTSPKGIVSQMAVPRGADASRDGYKNWLFMSVAHWNEDAVGDWTLHVFNNIRDQETGVFKDWSLKLWGECEDETKAKLFSYDGNYMDVPIPSSTPSSIPSSTSTPPSEWIGLPTFGMGRTALWLYGAFLLILAFVIGVCCYIFIYKKQSKNGRFSKLPDAPLGAFELVPREGDDDDDEMELMTVDSSMDNSHETQDMDDAKRKRMDFYKGIGAAYKTNDTQHDNERHVGSSDGGRDSDSSNTLLFAIDSGDEN